MEVLQTRQSMTSLDFTVWLQAVAGQWRRVESTLISLVTHPKISLSGNSGH